MVAAVGNTRREQDAAGTGILLRPVSVARFSPAPAPFGEYPGLRGLPSREHAHQHL
jgi:hypothetical protein